MPRAIAAALLAAAVALGACGGNDHKASSVDAPTKPLPAKPAPADIAPGGGLAIGMTEINPDLFWHGKDVGAFTPWRDRFEALKPPLYRLVVDWSSLQPKQGGPIDWTKASDGCMRGLPPCRPYSGIRDTLRAIHSQQQAGNGFATMVVIYGVPDWAAASAHGCERDGITARSRPINAQGLDGYKKLIGSLQDLAKSEGVDINWWSPWNEPNGPFFISPQRERCKGSSKSLAPAVYAKLARAMRTELKPGQQLVVGELAGLKNARKYGTSISEFFDGLPDDVVCNAGVFAQHQYSKRGGAANDPGAVGNLEDGPRPARVHQGQADLGHRERRRRPARRRRALAQRTRASAPTARPSTCRCAAGTTTRAWTPSSSTPSATTRSSRSGWPTRS